ncbi:MAG: alpha/beta hydrolase-fold protein [Mariniphaga sp.]
MRRLSLTVFLFLMAVIVSAQTGKVSDNLSMTSKILKMERKYAIYLPPDYETSQRSYPVLYLLHGSGDDQTGWVQFGEVLRIADKSLVDGTATPMIIVMPDGNTGRRGYFNDVKGDWNYEDFFFQELIPFIEKTYRAKTDKRYRAISGLSMGGGGTFMYALHHPELFSAACPLSASVGPLTMEEASTRLKRQNPDVTEAQVSKYFSSLSALELVNNMPEDQKKSVRWYIDCGDDDNLSIGNCLVHNSMLKYGIPHEFRIRDGAHNWTYWRDALPKVLEFVSMSFHQY